MIEEIQKNSDFCAHMTEYCRPGQINGLVENVNRYDEICRNVCKAMLMYFITILTVWHNHIALISEYPYKYITS